MRLISIDDLKAPGGTILFWHRGPSLGEIALGHAMIGEAHRPGIGQRRRFA